MLTAAQRKSTGRCCIHKHICDDQTHNHWQNDQQQ